MAKQNSVSGTLKNVEVAKIEANTDDVAGHAYGGVNGATLNMR